MHSSRVERRYVTRKRMERRAPDGQLLSVTNTRTVQYTDPQQQCRSSRIQEEPVLRQSLPPPSSQRRSVSVSPRHRCPNETLRRTSVEYHEPPFVQTYPREGGFDQFTREDEYHKTIVTRQTPSPRRRDVTWVSSEQPSPRRKTVEWTETRTIPEDDYEEIDRHRRPSQERVYFGRDDLSGSSPLTFLLNRINEIRKSNGKRELVPCPRLASVAGRWAERIVNTGDFRRDINEKMSVWRGRRVTDSIVDSWYEEAVEFRTSNFINMDWLRTVGAGSAYWPEKNQHVVVVIYD